jgi:hypothetical protein
MRNVHARAGLLQQVTCCACGIRSFSVAGHIIHRGCENVPLRDIENVMAGRQLSVSHSNAVDVVLPSSA